MCACCTETYLTALQGEFHDSLQSPAAMKELGGDAAQARLHQRACLVAN
jgi:hypothetical protein